MWKGNFNFMEYPTEFIFCSFKNLALQQEKAADGDCKHLFLFCAHLSPIGMVAELEYDRFRMTFQVLKNSFKSHSKHGRNYMFSVQSFKWEIYDKEENVCYTYFTILEKMLPVLSDFVLTSD